MRRLVWLAGMVVLGATTAQAGRPLFTDDAEPVAPGQFELEAGVAYIKDGPTHHGDVPVSLTYGLPARLEIGAGFGGQFEERRDVFSGRQTEEGIADLTLGFKWKVLEQDRFWADQSLAGAVKLPTANEDEGLGSGEVDYSLAWIVTRGITEKLNAHLNVGYSWLGDSAEEDADDVLFYGVAVDYQLTERLQPVAEIFAESPIESDGRIQVLTNVGLRWLVKDNLVLDFAVGTGLTEEAPDLFATTGLTWAF